jgi:ABC-type transport system substrate-binding protein
LAESLTARTARNIPAIFLFGIFSTLFFAQETIAKDVLNIVGWPLVNFSKEKPNLDFGNDPVVGRQICPPLTRINLSKKMSESIVIRRAVQEFRGTGKGTLWRIELRNGIFWWSGKALNSQDVADFLKTTLPVFLSEYFGGIFQVPDYEIRANDPQLVTIDWKDPPPFGPYVLNGVPLFRQTDAGPAGLKYECVGNYKPESIEPLVLVPSSSYKQTKKLPRLRFHPESSTVNPDVKVTFSNPLGTKPLSAKSCSGIWPSPFFSIIAWNLESGRASDVGLRRLMTGLIPRNEIVASGVLPYSDIVSAPIPRSHPGFDPSAADMPFDATKVSAALDNLGFRRKTANSTRTDGEGKPIRLLLTSNNDVEGLAEKLISDSFSSVGLEVDFEETGTKNSGGTDGSFLSLHTDYPKMDFLMLLHPKSPETGGFWKVKDEMFAKLLEQYAISLSSEKPEFGHLVQIHDYLVEKQVFSVLAHHRACIKTSNVLRVKTASIAGGEPDWFRDLLF